MTPNRRADPIAEALGVDNLDRLRDALERARSSTDDVDGYNVPSVPSVPEARLIVESVGLPAEVGDRTIRSLSVTGGRPRHGALMSDSHVSAFEVSYSGDCPECESDRLRFKYQRHHNIAGSESIRCEWCKETLYSEDWG